MDAALQAMPAVRHEDRSRAELLLSPLGFSGLLALCIATPFLDVLIGANTFFFRDFSLFGYPLAHWHRESFWHGDIPLWNPYSDCGIPFLAQWNSLVLYPLSLIYVLLPLSWSLGIFCLGHLFLGGLGMYFLAYQWTGNRLGATVAGMVFAFNGLTLQCLMWPNNMAAFAWAPWVILAVEKASLNGGRALFCAALIGGLQMLTGAPEVIFLTWVLTGALEVVRLFRTTSSRARFPQALRLGVVVLLVSGIAAAQLLPFFDLARHSHRDALPESAGWAMPAWGWLNLLLPLFQMHSSSFGVYMQSGQGWTSSYYMGIGALALSVWAVLFVRHWRIAVLASAAVVGLMMALGNNSFFYPMIRAALPQIGEARYPIKCIVLTVLATPLLAGYAAAAWSHPSQMPTRLARLGLAGIGLVFTAVVAALLLLTYWNRPVPGSWNALLQNGIVRLIFLGLLLGILLAGSRASTPRIRAWIGLGCAAILWLDVLTHAPSQNPVVPRWVYSSGVVNDFLPTRPQPRLGESRAMVSPRADFEMQYSFIPDPAKNCLSRRAGLFNNWNLLDGIPKINGMYSLYPKEEAEVLTLLYASTNTYPQRLADFLSVSQISASTNIFSWEARSSCLPLVTAGQKPIFAGRSETLAALSGASFDPAREVYLPLEAKALLANIEAGETRVEPVRFESREIAFKTSNARPSLVVIAQTFYHWWKCTVDGQEAPVVRANHAFQAVPVPAGQHQVELRYDDRSFYWGSALSVATIATCLLGWAFGNRRSRPTCNAEAARDCAEGGEQNVPECEGSSVSTLSDGAIAGPRACQSTVQGEGVPKMA